jgi:hypothetical protein
MAVAEISTNAYQEIVIFMASRPELSALAAFHFSERVSERINELLTANRNRRLTDAEAAELDEFDRLEHMMRMVKLTAMEQLAAQQ